MFAADQYELLDFGHGRKLERFGPLLLDRPCPAADGCEPVESAWGADARFERETGAQGRWQDPPQGWPASWEIEHAASTFALKPTPFGHVGLFPEQAANWDWIGRQTARAGRPLHVLNLFAYTGGSTLAAAAAGASVTHVDAAKNVVQWARDNADRSGLADAPIRWIHDDARKFVRRERRRERRYDAVILDPPSYGHGARGEAWSIVRDLPSLLEDCAALTAASRAFLLLTCHSPGFDPPTLEAMLADAVFGRCGAGGGANELTLSDRQGRRLPAGIVARWP